MSNLGVIEKKALGALITLCDANNITRVSMRELARAMGYKATGGAITLALKTLEMNNHIERLENNTYKVFL
jgi:DNA-binding MarR family transcriptional regulator